jgi:monofunctional biosynthetic peptidoglycan transglycosylase
MLKRLSRWLPFASRRAQPRGIEPQLDASRFDLHPEISSTLLHALDELPPYETARPAPPLGAQAKGPVGGRAAQRQQAETPTLISRFMLGLLSLPLQATWRWLLLLLAAGLALQLFFLARIALMAHVDPQSTAFERSELWRLWQESRPQAPAVAQGPASAARKPAPAPAPKPLRWRQQWVDYERISIHLKRAVISSEDDAYVNHPGVDWIALQEAWLKNAAEQARAEILAQRSASQRTTQMAVRQPKVVGGSTITQQLAKNLFLSGERTMVRKAQELVLTLMLETVLDKRRILEIYLNHVEWGEGIFGAQAAAQRYYGKPAAQIAPDEAARLAVMLPRPRFFEKLPNSAYLAERASVIENRLWFAQLPE